MVWQNEDLDDLIMLRADGNPTYMLAVVVDDHDMGVTHVIRGDDHLINAARQTQIYDALGWDVPDMTHIPLIHGPDGSKLSKRHGALGVEAYRAMGYLPAALRNYLVRLGWSHGDEEIFSTEEMIEWFDLRSSAARLRASISPSWKISTAITSATPTIKSWWRISRIVLHYVPDGDELKGKLDEQKKSATVEGDAGTEGARQDAGRADRRSNSSLPSGRSRWRRRRSTADDGNAR